MTSRRLFLTAAALGGLAACSPPQSGGGGSEALTIYSNSISDGRGEWLTEKATEAGFSLSLVDLGGGDITNRLLAEASNPIADVVFGLNNVYFENLVASEVLEEYTPSWSGDVDVTLGDGSVFWPIVREPIMLVYNTETYPDPASAPSDWPDLWTNPAFHGTYEVPSSLGGATTQMVLSGLLARFLDPSGDLGVSDEGWESIGRYFEYGVPSVETTDLYARMDAGEVSAGQMWLAGKVTREEQYGVDTAAAHPEIGVPMAVQHVAQVAGTPRAELAGEFIDWFGGADVQAAWSQEFFTAPTHSGALANADQDAVEQTESFSTQDIDWTTVAENLNDWIEKIELDVLG